MVCVSEKRIIRAPLTTHKAMGGWGVSESTAPESNTLSLLDNSKGSQDDGDRLCQLYRTR